MWQLERERLKIICDDEFTASEPVELAMLKIKGRGVQVVGKGTFTAERESYIYDGILDGDPVRLEFPTAGTRFSPSMRAGTSRYTVRTSFMNSVLQIRNGA